MASSTSQQSKWRYPPVEFTKGINGLEKIILRQPRLMSAEIYLYGAQVTSWKNDYGQELLFMSSKATFKPTKSIRGGIPICFPRFSNQGILEAHGFVRNRFWVVDPDPAPYTTMSCKASVDLLLKSTEEDLKYWPHSFEYRLRITLSPEGNLLMISRIRNIDSKPFSFNFSYHTYFSVSDISEIRVEGVETVDYLDNLKDKERFTEQGDAIVFEGEIDKTYVSTPAKIAILDHERKRTFVILKDGLPDVVVWNPWDKKAKAIADLGNNDYKRMLCVEPAAIENPITLKPGEEWKGWQELHAVASSYCSGQLDPRKVLTG